MAIKKDNSLCLIFICRDSEKTINKMLDSVKPYVNEVVGTDTGSVDGTIKILEERKKEFEAEGKPFHIFHDKWENFGHNRTLMVKNAQKVAKSDWFMVIDADSWVEFKPEFKKEFNYDYDFYHLEWEYYGIWLTFPMLYRSDHEWKYEGYAHNVLDARGKRKGGTFPGILVHEQPRSNAESVEHAKRTEALLKKQIEDGSATDRTNFYYARTVMYSNPDEAVKYFEKVVNGGNWYEEKYIAYYNMGKMRNQEHRKVEHFLNAFQVNPRRAEAMNSLGEYFNSQRKYILANMIFLQIINLKNPPDALFSDKSVYDYKMYFNYAITLYWIGQYEKSYEFAMKVKRTENVPEHIQVQNDKNLEFIIKKLQPVENEETR